MDIALRWSIVIPVKVLARAKSRLATLAGPRRPELALAMAADTVAAAVACGSGTVIVVTDDAAATVELAGLGALVLPDEPDTGLNRALEFGAAHAAARWPERGRAALAADLPALSRLSLAGRWPRRRACLRRSWPTPPAPERRCTWPVRKRRSARSSARVRGPGIALAAPSSLTWTPAAACGGMWTRPPTCGKPRR